MWQRPIERRLASTPKFLLEIRCLGYIRQRIPGMPRIKRASEYEVSEEMLRMRLDRTGVSLQLRRRVG